jgi:hypothetical protein
MDGSATCWGGSTFGQATPSGGAFRQTSAGGFHTCAVDEGTRCLLTVMLTDGDTLVAVHGGKELFISTHKTRCADRDSCPSLAHACEAPTDEGRVNHCIISSEPLLGENVWAPLRPGDVIAVDHAMQLARTRLDTRSLAVVT